MTLAFFQWRWHPLDDAGSLVMRLASLRWRPRDGEGVLAMALRSMRGYWRPCDVVGVPAFACIGLGVLAVLAL